MSTSILSLVDETFKATQFRILSVDDDPVNQLVIATCLEPEGYEVVQAMDGFEALNAMKELSAANKLPDLILLDVMMPGMSGFEVCASVRELYPLSIPILMISAKRAKEDVLKGLSNACNDYITKPFDKNELLARIQSKIKLNILKRLRASKVLLPSGVGIELFGVGRTGQVDFPKAVCVYVILCAGDNSGLFKLSSLVKKFDLFTVSDKNTNEMLIVDAYGDKDLKGFFNTVISDLVEFAPKIGVAMGPLKGAIIEPKISANSPGARAFFTVCGDAVDQARKLAMTKSVICSVSVNEEMAHEIEKNPGNLLPKAHGILRYLLTTGLIPSDKDLEISVLDKIKFQHVFNSLDFSGFSVNIKNNPNSVSDETSSIYKMMEIFSVPGKPLQGTESSIKTSLHDLVETAKRSGASEQSILDTLYKSAEIISQLLAATTVANAAASAKSKARKDNLENWRKNALASFDEVSKAASYMAPSLLDLEREQTRKIHLEDKLKHLKQFKDSLNVHLSGISNELAIADKETDLIENEVVKLLGSLYRSTHGTL
jgi:CheY-like chemotaxis protein